MKPAPSRLVAALAVAFAASVSAAPPAQTTPLDEVEKAYDELESYRSTVDISIEQQRGGWTLIQKGQANVAYDAETGRLSVEHPGYELVVADKLRMKTDQLPGTHLEVDAATPVTYSQLESVAQPLLQPPLPDVVLLTSDEAETVLGEGTAGPVTLDEADGTRKVKFDTSTGAYVLTLDPQSGLVTRAVHEMDPAKVGAPAGSSARVVFDVRPQPDAELPEDAFAFDTTNSRAADSLQAMLAGAGGGPGGGGGGAHPLQDQPAPAIELATADGEPYKLADDEAEVVVLDFWATWCPPCREGLPHIEAIYDWAKAENKPVAVYAVNEGETVEEAKQYWQQAGFEMPVLMDPDMKVGDAYGVTGIPQTVVIADGKVRHVHVGFNPGMEAQLKGEIEALLDASGSEAEADAPATN